MADRIDTPASPEEEATQALQAGDRERALTVLMRAYGDALYRFCRQMVVDPELAEDVHQMTFIQAFESLGQFGGRSSLRSWLYGIARHRCLDAIKMRSRRRRRFQEKDTLPEVADPSVGAEEHVVREGLREVLRRCLEKLAPKIRTAVLLRFHDGFSYPEMAAICHERAATLQARVVRALPSIRQCVEAHGFAL